MKRAKTVRLLPRQVKGGHLRDDILLRAEKFYDRPPRPPGNAILHRDAVPAVGQVATVEVDLVHPMRGACVPSTTWFLLTGTVVEVMDRWRVRAVMASSCDACPRTFDGQWNVVLTYDGTWHFPWLMVSMLRIAGPPGLAPPLA